MLLSLQGGEVVDTINERFKRLRKSCTLNQEEWGKILGISRAGVSDIESGRRNVTNKHIRLLSSNPIHGKYINEDWLRDGTGEMFLPVPEEDEVASYVAELLDPNNPFADLIVEIMRTYSQLDSKSQEVLLEFSRKLIENIKKEG